ncbi:hypothetical protein [Flavobacterium chungnamense]|uniref:CvpA family protein n=1 Tax=Flavobacterium chungnamense TaxID=706182 RepID=A0ABP7UZB3_9FLAO
MADLFNYLLSALILLLGVRFIFISYTKPDVFYSSTLKGYLAGFLFILMSIMSFLGKFSLYSIITKLVRNSLMLKGENGGLSFAIFITIIFMVLFFTYYRPDKLIRKYKVLKNDLSEKINLLSNYVLFYFWFLFVILYLILR